MENINELEIKQIVREKYAQVVESNEEEGCCGTSCGCGGLEETNFSEDYTQLAGYVATADFALGCGLPTEFAQIKEGDTVVDLGSGAGNDGFIARAITGEKGKVIGVDMTPKMVEKARQNADKLGFSNVEFYLGEIENTPLKDNIADVVVSNCVFNLIPNKQKAFKETHRILKDGGHLSISDIVLLGDLPENLRKDAEMYAGCVSGAIQKKEYLQILQDVGFQNIQIQKERKISLPDEVLLRYLSESELADFKQDKIGIYSITVYAEKLI
jgi:arsenite methyltransferase